MDKLDGTTLTGVSETSLWTLWNRGAEAARPDRIIDDPLAVQLVERIEYPYRERFGFNQQAFPIRALAFDSAVRRYYGEHPGGAVVALAEGLQTSYWRLGRPQSPWVSVDLEPVVALRERLLPKEEHVVHAPLSALDPAWMDLVPANPAPLITAEGLFMYFDEPTVLELIRKCAERFPGGRLVFDATPWWWSRQKNKVPGAKRDSSGAKYAVPPFSSGISAKVAAQLPSRIPGVASARQVPVPAGRGLAGRSVRHFYESPLVPSRWRFALYELRFSTAGS